MGVATTLWEVAWGIPRKLVAHWIKDEHLAKMDQSDSMLWKRPVVYHEWDVSLGWVPELGSDQKRLKLGGHSRSVALKQSCCWYPSLYPSQLNLL